MGVFMVRRVRVLRSAAWRNLVYLGNKDGFISITAEDPKKKVPDDLHVCIVHTWAYANSE